MFLGPIRPAWITAMDAGDSILEQLSKRRRSAVSVVRQDASDWFAREKSKFSAGGAFQTSQRARPEPDRDSKVSKYSGSRNLINIAESNGCDRQAPRDRE